VALLTWVTVAPAYTWTNKRFNTTPTFQRLDHSLANVEWCTAYPRTTVYHLPMLRGDHAPILTILDSNHPRTNVVFRFENWWLMEQDYVDVAKTSWLKSSNRTFHQKTKYLAADVKKWRKTKPSIFKQLGDIESLHLQQQAKPPHQQDFDIQKHLATQHMELHYAW